MHRALLIPALLIACGLAPTSHAQSPASPGQFYANAQGQYAWTADAKRKWRTTELFAKNPADNPNFRQLTAIIYDAQPARVIYIDKAAKRVVGALDLKAEKFSLLKGDAQKVRQAFDTIEFPPPGELPTVADMFAPLPTGQRGNAKKLTLPPPTLQFPRLEHSTWETSYMSIDKFLIRSELALDGDKGTYRLTGKPGTGRVSNVTYGRDGEEHLIQGNWNLGRASGTFRFNVPAKNLNVFWGQFSFQDGKTVGAWDGVRKPENGGGATSVPRDSNE